MITLFSFTTLSNILKTFDEIFLLKHFINFVTSCNGFYCELDCDSTTIKFYLEFGYRREFNSPD